MMNFIKNNQQFGYVKITGMDSDEVKNKLKENGIENSQYRIVHYSGEKELVAKADLIETIKNILF